MFGKRTAADVRLDYRDVSKDGVEFRQERVTSIDPARRRVTTDADSYDADVLAVALGADYDHAATAGFEEGGFEYYSIAGAERMRDVLPEFDSGSILIAILGHPFKCPPAPFEAAFLLHDHLVEWGVREAAEIRVMGPMAAPVPITKEVSQGILGALQERAIEYVPNQLVVSLDSLRPKAPPIAAEPGSARARHGLHGDSAEPGWKACQTTRRPSRAARLPWWPIASSAVPPAVAGRAPYASAASPQVARLAGRATASSGVAARRTGDGVAVIG